MSCPLPSLAVEKEEKKLKAELVAEKDPEMLGVVPASDIVGVVGRPWALELILLTELELAAGVTEDSELDGGTQPAVAWYIFRKLASQYTSEKASGCSATYWTHELQAY